MTVTQEALIIKRAVLSLYQIRVGKGKDRERIIEDCVADALKGKEDLELPGNFHDCVEEAALNGDVEAELRRLNAIISTGMKRERSEE